MRYIDKLKRVTVISLFYTPPPTPRKKHKKGQSFKDKLANNLGATITIPNKKLPNWTNYLPNFQSLKYSLKQPRCAKCIKYQNPINHKLQIKFYNIKSSRAHFSKHPCSHSLWWIFRIGLHEIRKSKRLLFHFFCFLRNKRWRNNTRIHFEL